MPERLKLEGILDYLERDDKWYICGGRAAMYAPEFPAHPETLGYWDEAYYADQRIETGLFCVLVLDDALKPTPLPRPTRSWRPDRVSLTFDTPELTITEEKVILTGSAGDEKSGDVFCSKITFKNNSPNAVKLNLILWSFQEQRAIPQTRDRAINDLVIGRDSASWRNLRDLKGGHQNLYLRLGADRPCDAYTVNLAEAGSREPAFEVAPFSEKLRDGLLCGEENFEVGIEPGSGFVHIGMQYAIEIAANTSESIAFGAAASFDEDGARAALAELGRGDPVLRAEESWNDYFEHVPFFECSDEYIERYYWYRWYGLRLLTVDLDCGNYRYPCVFEGIGYFRRHISYSAQCHMLEARWMGSPRLANGSLLGLLANQRRDGFIPGAVSVNSVEDYMYHANWGRCALSVFCVNHDRRFLETVYEPLKRYAQWLMIDRDRENSQVYDVIDQAETGQEYNARYLEADPDADDWRKIRLKGVDATVYAYELFAALGKMARLIDQPLEAGRWEREAELTRAAVRSLMWDPEQKMFFDVNPAGLGRCRTKGPVCFYPFMTDIATEEHLPSIHEHLLNREEFWTEFPVPTVSLDDPHFDAEGQWKGKRMSCPWSGRVWPMTNSHTVDALARAARTLDDSLRPEAAHLLRRFVEMMFFDQNKGRPNCFEHYNPFTGHPCEYRGVDDYQHSWVVDLIIKHVAGLVPQEEQKLLVDPLPFDLEYFTLDNIFYKGHRVRIAWRREKIDDEEVGLSVYVDGTLRASEPVLSKIEIEL